MFHRTLLALAASLFSASIVCAIPWNATQYMFVFGDSYSADGYNVSTDIGSLAPRYTTADGPNWIGFLTSTYNQTAVKTFNLAYGGATIDSALVPPYRPGVFSLVDQVAEFNEYLASKPEAAQWDSTNTLFAVWIGINDVGTTVGWTNITQSKFHGILMHRLFSQVDDLYRAGARNFLFLTVPPVNRSPLVLGLGSQLASELDADIIDYNTRLRKSVRNFQAKHADLGAITVFDTQPIFNVLLDHWKTFGFVNVTGYCAEYENGTSTHTYQVEGCAPVSSYFWMNSLHPLFTVHDFLAKAISTTLTGYGAI